MEDKLVVFLVEEKSMAEFLKKLLPHILPSSYIPGKNYTIHPHQGKNDLQQSIPRKIKGFRKYNRPVYFVIVMDQDSNDCMRLLEKLKNIVLATDRKTPFLIRIACRELENWYLGDLPAVEKIYPHSKATRQQNKAKFRNHCDNMIGAKEMGQLTYSEFSKTQCAIDIVQYMNLGNNRSASFNHFVCGIKKFLNI